MTKAFKDPTVEAMRKRLRIASDLFDLARAIKSHQLRKKHPGASEEEIRAKTMELIDKGCR